MSELVWGQIGTKEYETGVSKAVLYPYNPTVEEVTGKLIGYKPGVAWQGITSVSENPSGAEATPQYADNTKYITLFSAEEFGATIGAFMSPEEFDECDGTVEIADGVSIGQQERKTFGFCYSSIIGNDTLGDAYGEKIHIFYGCKASPSERTYNTVNESPEAGELSWEISTTPVNVTGKKPTAYLTIEKNKLTAAAWKAISDALYGTASTDPYLPLPDEIVALIDAADANPENPEDPDAQG